MPPASPSRKGIGATEQTILATAAAYVIVWYCGRRLDAFPRATLQGNVGYVAPVAAIAYSAIAVLLLLLRSDYSRVQLFGSRRACHPVDGVRRPAARRAT